MNTPFLRRSALLPLAVFVSIASAAEPLEGIERSATEWVKLRVEATRLETDWAAERGLVESMLQALQERATTLEEKRDLAKAKTAKEREELETMRNKNRSAHEDLQALEARLKGLSEKLVALRPSLPPRLSDALEMTYRSLADAEIGPGERMLHAMNVLNRCAQFNRLVTAGDDVLTLDGAAKAKSFEVIYWGLSHGYAIDRTAQKAWIGFPDQGRWKWEPRPEAFGSVVKLIAVATDKSDPDFIAVPAQVTRIVGEKPEN